jgi:hypothetical protein
MGPAMPFTYAARSLAEANGLHADTNHPQVRTARPRRRVRRWKRNA